MAAVPILVPFIRLTDQGDVRVTSDGAVRITGFFFVYDVDILALIDLHFPGIVVQRNLVEAVSEWLVDHSAGWITDADVVAILARANELLDDDVVAPARYVPTTQDHYPTALPPYPSGLPRFPDSNPATDGWSIADGGMVVR